jgi:transcriptional regulator with XRE-family HTH domain
MTEDKSLLELSKVRRRIARQVSDLRAERLWTQAELARRLGVSQSHISDLERGRGSFTAEQFLALLQLFNVPASQFSPTTSSGTSELQNALARLGASHLRENPDVIPDERFEDLTYVIREALLADSARHITALAPVLVENIEGINLRRALGELADAGLDRRFAWLIDNVVEALREEVPRLPSSEWTRKARRAETLLAAFFGFLSDHFARSTENSPDDLLDSNINNPKTLEEVKRSSSPASRRWRIVTSLQPIDFVEALRGARAAR